MLGKDLREIIAVFVGGGIGTVARAGLGTAVITHKAAWPWPTFIVNMVAAFALGYFTTRLLERLPPSSYRRPLLGTGLCGGLIGYSISGLQCDSGCGTRSGVGALIGAILAAGGVAVVAVLVLRAMAEWRVIEHTGDPKAARAAQRSRRLRSLAVALTFGLAGCILTLPFEWSMTLCLPGAPVLLFLGGVP